MITLLNKKLIILAYACEPNSGGEHEVGWRISEEMAKISNEDIHVITRGANKEKILNEINKNANYHFIEVNRFLFLKPKGGFSYLYYIFWQFKAYLYIRSQFSNDTHIHLLTFGNIHLPSFIFLLKNPYSLGPMGGGAFVDTKLILSPSFREKFKSSLYKVINYISKVNPVFLYNNTKAKCIITRTDDTKKIISGKNQLKTINILETGVDEKLICDWAPIQKSSLTKFINVSRFIESKNIEVAIKTFNELNKLNEYKFKYSLIGDGPLFKSIFEKYNSEYVNFMGKVEHQKVREFLNESDVMLTCTVKEAGSHAIFEAMTEGCVVACYNISGMKNFPSNDSAIKFEPSSDIENNINNFAIEINSNLKNQCKILKNANLSLRNQTWSEKAKSIYEFIKQ